MLGNYKYQHISAGRLKALKVGVSEFSNLYRDLEASDVIAPALIERLRRIQLLLGRAANHSTDLEEQEFLTKILGHDMGEEKQE